MNTDNVSKNQFSLTVRSLEILGYTILATVLIGHVMFIDGPMTLINISLVLLGAIVGLFLSFGMTPVHTYLLSTNKTRLHSTVLPFTSKHTDPKRASSIDNKHAA